MPSRNRKRRAKQNVKRKRVFKRRARYAEANPEKKTAAVRESYKHISLNLSDLLKGKLHIRGTWEAILAGP